jgi:hypothetical protein
MPSPARHAWRRRLKILAALGILACVTLLLFRLLLYPHTFAGKFDRIRMGMSDAETRALLGPAAQPPSPWTAYGFHGKVTRIVRHVRGDNGQETTETLQRDEALDLSIELHFTNVFQHHGYGNGPARIVVVDKWMSPDAVIFVQFDEQGRVSMKSWVELQSSRSVWRRLRSWLGLA